MAGHALGRGHQDGASSLMPSRSCGKRLGMHSLRWFKAIGTLVDSKGAASSAVKFPALCGLEWGASDRPRWCKRDGVVVRGNSNLCPMPASGALMDQDLEGGGWLSIDKKADGVAEVKIKVGEVCAWAMWWPCLDLLLLPFLIFLLNPKPIVKANFAQNKNASEVIVNPLCTCSKSYLCFQMCKRDDSSPHEQDLDPARRDTLDLFTKCWFCLPLSDATSGRLLHDIPAFILSLVHEKKFHQFPYFRDCQPIVCNLLHYRMESDHGAGASLQVRFHFLPLLDPRTHTCIHTCIHIYIHINIHKHIYTSRF